MKEEEQPKPPRWADRFLEWFCNPKLLEQIQGDIYELFYWRLEQKGKNKAVRAFAWDVIRLFKWENVKRRSAQTTHFNNTVMFKNYFKIGWRNILRQKMPSFINITGLSCAIGCCIVAFMFIEPRIIKDQFHENGKNIYLVAHKAFLESRLNSYGNFSSVLAEELPENFPQVKRRIRYKSFSNVIRVKGNIFNDNVHYVDPDFLHSFSFPMVNGSKDVLKDPSKVVIDESTAVKFFGDEDPIDKLVKVISGKEEMTFAVGGIIEDAPTNSSMKPSILLNYELLNSRGRVAPVDVATFLELKEGIDEIVLEKSFQSMVSVQNGLELDSQYESIFLVPLETMAKRNLSGAPGGAPPNGPIILLISIASLMLLLAISNYVNIAILMATKRIKEIGIRKTIGSKRSQIISQFLTENLILCALSILLGIALAKGIFLPWFNDMSGLSVKMNLFSNKNLWLFLGLLLLVITFLSGFYPALYISKFKPSVIFRGKEKLGKKWGFTGALITFQLVLSIITIVGGVMFVRTNNMQEGIEWEFEKGDKILVNIPGSELYPSILNTMIALPGVEDVVGTDVALGQAYWKTEFYLGDSKNSASLIQCGSNYPEFMGLELKEGRFFDPQLLSDTQSSVLINEKFAERYEVKIDGLIQIDSVFHKVVGVLNDFHYNKMTNEIEPLMIKAKPDPQLRYLALKVTAGMEVEMERKVREAWVDLVKDKPYYGFLQSAVFDQSSGESRGLKNTMLFTATLATILAAMGIFGLASLSISSRMKDFGIKKILGASLLQITKPVYVKFGIMLGIAVVTGSTLAIFIIGLFLDTIYKSNHDPVSFVPLLFAALILGAVVFVTISSQIGKVKKMNPAEILRMD
ncbi:MAG: putative ABC transport system permease protein [Arcticibacterium sp.]|jgi:putative ABC transport system permease protein